MFCQEDTVALITEAKLAAQQLAIYRHLREDNVFKSFYSLIGQLLDEDAQISSLLDCYYNFFNELVWSTELSNDNLCGNAWKNYLLEFILTDENTFSRKAAMTSWEEMGPSLLAAVKNDLNTIQKLAAISSHMITTVLHTRLENTTVSGWEELMPLGGSSDKNKDLFKEKFLHSENWANLIAELAQYYHRFGTGLCAKYSAFRWDSSTNCPVGISHPDPISMAQLTGYEKQRQTVLANTAYFLKGFPANNILLYGDRGTGKSSTVKALLKAFKESSLKILEVSQNQLQDLGKVLDYLRRQTQKFIIFIDDLSFEEYQVEFKNLKAILEGSLEMRPTNVLIYATSNRRHLVKEFFSERDSGNNPEVHSRDTIEEKLSLSDRFGISLTFASPNQNQYLEIVSHLARINGIKLPLEELHRQALDWELWHNARSGRTAKQFIDHLAAQAANN